MEQLVTIGIVVILIGFALVFIGSFAGGKGDGTAKIAVGGFIGPIPFGFANDRSLLYVVIAVAMTVFVVSLLMSQKLF
jgi:uncharacterized membrane protein